MVVSFPNIVTFVNNLYTKCLHKNFKPLLNYKSMRTITIFIFIACTLQSCNDEEKLIGLWDDIIKLSEKEVTISAESNSLVITTEGTEWWINEIGLDDDWSYDIDGIDTKQDFLIEENDFIIERRNTNEIHISMTENQSDLDRILSITLQAGNYSDRVRIIQSRNTTGDEEKLIGFAEDIIKLSEREFTISAESSLLIITTEGTRWCIKSIGLDDDWSYDTGGIDATMRDFLIEENDFSIERKNMNEIHISMTENQSDLDRILNITLQAGNYFDGIRITQSGS